jgi:hypothetical protein
MTCTKCGVEVEGTKLCLGCSPDGTLFKSREETMDSDVRIALEKAVRVVNGIDEDSLEYRDRDALADLREALGNVRGLGAKLVKGGEL